jgi:hypothetical protein
MRELSALAVISMGSAAEVEASIIKGRICFMAVQKLITNN